MKYIKRVLILTLIMLTLVGMSSVCAGDVNDTAIASEDNQIIKETNDEDIISSLETEDNERATDEELILSLDSNYQELNSSNNANMVFHTFQSKLGASNTSIDTLSATSKSFADIQAMVDNAKAGDTIYLSGNYYGTGTHIKITKSLRVEGNRAILDAKGLSKIFEITGSDVMINNIIFKNGHSASAGAIDWWNGNYDGQSTSNGLLTNCNFINCSASYYAGAVYFCSSSLTMYNCTFAGNSAFKGGAVYVSGDNCIVESCEFYSNLINLNPGNTILPAGAAICCEGNNIIIDDCIFAYNDVNGELSYNYDYWDDFEDKYGMGIRIMDNKNNLSKILISNSIFNNALTLNLFYSNNPDYLYRDNYSSNIFSNNKYYLAYDTCSFNNESYGGFGISENYVNVKSTKTTISVPNIVFDKDKTTTISATIKTTGGKLVTQGKVLFCINGKYYFAKVNNGKASISLKLGDSNNAIICSAKYIPEFSIGCYYESSMTNFNAVKKQATKIIANNKNYKAKTITKKYSVTLKTNKNKAIKKAKLILKVKGKTYTAKTNSNGKATFKITKLTKKGTYNAVITFKGNNNYKKVTKTVKFKVK